MGSQSNSDKAYIAGFLDGDGSIMLQIKNRNDTKRSFRFMATICLYQDSRHDTTFIWVRSVLGVGYLSKRKDGMSELRINGYTRVKSILLMLLPFIRFKRKQAQAMIKACSILETIPLKKMKRSHLKRLVELVLFIQNQNYSTKRKRKKVEFYQQLGLTP